MIFTIVVFQNIRPKENPQNLTKNAECHAFHLLPGTAGIYLYHERMLTVFPLSFSKLLVRLFIQFIKCMNTEWNTGLTVSSFWEEERMLCICCIFITCGCSLDLSINQHSFHWWNNSVFHKTYQTAVSGHHRRQMVEKYHKTCQQIRTRVETIGIRGQILKLIHPHQLRNTACLTMVIMTLPIN